METNTIRYRLIDGDKKITTKLQIVKINNDHENIIETINIGKNAFDCFEFKKKVPSQLVKEMYESIKKQFLCTREDFNSYCMRDNREAWNTDQFLIDLKKQLDDERKLLLSYESEYYLTKSDLDFLIFKYFEKVLCSKMVDIDDLNLLIKWSDIYLKTKEILNVESGKHLSFCNPDIECEIKFIMGVVKKIILDDLEEKLSFYHCPVTYINEYERFNFLKKLVNRIEC